MNDKEIIIDGVNISSLRLHLEISKNVLYLPKNG